MKQLVLILGGVRSGKSSFAEKLAAQLGERVLFVATAQPLDVEMRKRIEKHRLKRSGSWRTLEAPLQVGAALKAHLGDADVVLLDCLTVLVSNLMMGTSLHESQPDGVSPEDLGRRVNEELEGLLSALEVTETSLVVVSNEVGMGLVPPYLSGRIYRDILGQANQILAQRADQVYWLFAGIPVELKALGSSLGMPTSDRE